MLRLTRCAGKRSSEQRGEQKRATACALRRTGLAGIGSHPPRCVPKPRVNLTRFHGVFAPNSAHRAQVTKAHRGKGASARAAAETDERTPAERRAAMSWAQRLKRVFNIDIETCSVCGGVMRIIACIEDAVVIEKILAHLDAKAAAAQAARPPPSRAPPARAPRWRWSRLLRTKGAWSHITPICAYSKA